MSSGNLTLEQLQFRLANATGKMHRVLTNQIRRLIESLQTLIPAPPPTRPPITRKRLTLLEQLKLSEFKYSTPQRGYKLYNPVKDTYISNTKLNRENVKKQIEAHNEKLYSNYFLQQLQTTNLPSVNRTRQRDIIQYSSTAGINNWFNVITLTNITDIPLLGFITAPASLSAIKLITQKQFTKHGQIRVYITTNIQFIRAGDETPTSFGMNLPTKTLLTLQNITEAFTSVIQDLIDKIDVFEARGTGWMLVKIMNITLNISKYNPSTGGSYIPTPIELVDKCKKA